MNKDLLLKLLEEVAAGVQTVPDAARQLEHLACQDLGYAHVDHHRSLRKGFPEVIYGEGKSAEQIAGILQCMIDQESVILATRVDPAKARDVQARFHAAQYHPEARMLVWQAAPAPVAGRGTVLVIAAGTSDIPVAMEAVITAQAMGNRVEKIIDVGVAGIHRLFRHREMIENASVLVVVAGMEGALPSVVAGMVSRPVIAVPTSIGYGVSLGGLTALFAMLNSCSSNVAVVNIDNGFGAGYVASMINRA
jgi:pyridinium-3,5-biscarboxylic acid mononucleotide synthase